MSSIVTKEFESMWNYVWALVRILGEETDERVVRKIRNFRTKKEAKVFSKKWRNLFYERREGLRNLRLNDVEETKRVIEIIHQEFKCLGIRIP